MLSRDSVHLSKLQRNPNKCVKYKYIYIYKLSITRNREVKQFYIVPINDDEFSFSQSPSTLIVGCVYFLTYIPTDHTDLPMQGSADLTKVVVGTWCKHLIVVPRYLMYGIYCSTQLYIAMHSFTQPCIVLDSHTQPNIAIHSPTQP